MVTMLPLRRFSRFFPEIYLVHFKSRRNFALAIATQIHLFSFHPKFLHPMLNYNKIQRKDPQTNNLGWYPNIVLKDNIGIDQLVAGIVEKCTLTKVDVKAVLIALEEVVIDNIKAGNSVRFSALGSFRPTFKTRKWIVDNEETGAGHYGNGGQPVATTTYNAKGEVDMQGVTADDIAGVKVVFTPSGELARKLDRSQLDFKQVEGEKPYRGKID